MAQAPALSLSNGFLPANWQTTYVGYAGWQAGYQGRLPHYFVISLMRNFARKSGDAPMMLCNMQIELPVLIVAGILGALN